MDQALCTILTCEYAKDQFESISTENIRSSSLVNHLVTLLRYEKIRHCILLGMNVFKIWREKKKKEKVKKAPFERLEVQFEGFSKCIFWSYFTL